MINVTRGSRIRLIPSGEEYEIADLLRALVERDELRAKVQKLEAPPVAPAGYEVCKVAREVDPGEYQSHWELWVRDSAGFPITVASAKRGELCHPSGISDPFDAFRALMWAAERDP